MQSIAVTPSNPTIHLPTTIHLGIGQQFTATGTYSDGTAQNITAFVRWTSSNTNVATVDDMTAPGLATPLISGSTTITATLSNISGTSVLNVSEAALQSIIINLSLNSSSIYPKATSGTIHLDVNKQFIATGTYTDGLTQDITTSAIWSSSSTDTATISNVAGSQGLLAPVAAGTTTITALFNGQTASFALTVSSATLQSITITPASLSIPAGVEKQFVATGTYSDGSTQNITTAVIWNLSNTNIATISNAAGSQGLLTPIIAGNANITANLNGSSSNTSSLTVTTAILQSITVTPANSSIPLGVQKQFTAIGTYSDASTVDYTSLVLWSSSTKAATISNSTNNGLAIAVSVGTTLITASFQNITATTTLTVDAATLQSITITPTNPTISTTISTTLQLTAIGIYSDGSQQNITTTVNWSSLNTTVATISNTPGSNGLATAIVAGSSTITASLSGVSSIATLTVTTVAAPNAYIVNSVINGKILKCDIDPITGNISNCIDSLASSFLSGNTPIAIQFSATGGSFAWITTTTQVYVCALNPATKLFTGCNSQSVSGFTISTSAVNPANTVFALGKSTAGFLAVCDANPSTGAVTGCLNVTLTGGASPLTNVPYGIAMSNLHIYLGSPTGSKILDCNPVPTVGSPNATCVTPTKFGQNPDGFGIFQGYLYLLATVGTNSFSNYLISLVDGSLGAPNNLTASLSPVSLTGLVDPQVVIAGVSLGSNNYVYMTYGFAFNQVMKCTVNSGVIVASSCSNIIPTGLSLSTPVGIAIY